MREIILRGKQEVTGEWIYGFPFAAHACLNVEGIEKWDGERHFVNPETVGQFIGLLDKNGTKIFEGDIVKYQRSSWDKGTIEAVEWDNDSCGFEPFSDSRENCGHCGGGMSPECCEIIGNIHDDPELLEEKHGC